MANRRIAMPSIEVYGASPGDVRWWQRNFRIHAVSRFKKIMFRAMDFKYAHPSRKRRKKKEPQPVIRVICSSMNDWNSVSKSLIKASQNQLHGAACYVWTVRHLIRGDAFEL